MSEVDVVIPTTGRPSLDRAIQSALGQRGVHVSIFVVVDDLDRLDDVTARHGSQVSVIPTPGGVGGGMARTIGTNSGTSPWVAYLDDDDWWEPHKLQVQLSAMETDGNFSWTGTRFYAGAVQRVLPEVSLEDSGFTPASYLVRRPGWKHGFGYIQTSSLLVSRGFLADVGGWDSALRKHQDWDLVIRLLESPTVCAVPIKEPLVHVVQGSIGSVSKVRDWRTSMPFFERHRAKMDRRSKSDFVWCHLVRSALASAAPRDAIRMVLRYGRHPHLAAIAVGLLGLKDRWSSRSGAIQ